MQNHIEPLNDEYVEYAAEPYGKRKPCIRVRVYEGPHGRVALATEPFNNPGASITNTAEYAVAAIQQRFGSDVQVIEHYPYRRPEEETFDLLSVVDGQPDWKPLTRAQAIAFIGCEPEAHDVSHEPAWFTLANTSRPIPPGERAAEEAEALAHEAAEHEWRRSIASTAAPEPTYIGVYDHKDELRILFCDESGARVIEHYKRHSPSGFAVGYMGSGPADAARCILADALNIRPTGHGDMPRIEAYYQKFKGEVIARLPQRGTWRIPQAKVLAWFENAVRLTQRSDREEKSA